MVEARLSYYNFNTVFAFLKMCTHFLAPSVFVYILEFCLPYRRPEEHRIIVTSAPVPESQM
jgi:hypothetical protein